MSGGTRGLGNRLSDGHVVMRMEDLKKTQAKTKKRVCVFNTHVIAMAAVMVVAGGGVWLVGCAPLIRPSNPTPTRYPEAGEGRMGLAGLAPPLHPVHSRTGWATWSCPRLS